MGLVLIYFISEFIFIMKCYNENKRGDKTDRKGKDGWYLVRVKGDHRQYKHPSKKGLVTISGHFNEDVAKGTLNSILKLKQAGLKEVKEDG